MELDFALLADAATVDGSGKLNVLGVFDRIQARDFPARHGRIALVLRFSAGIGEGGTHQVEIRLRTPGGDEVLRLDGRLDLGTVPRRSDDQIKVPHVLNLDGIAFPHEGTYSFDISADGQHLTSVPLRVEAVSSAGASVRTAAGGRQPPPFALGPGGSAQA